MATKKQDDLINTFHGLGPLEKFWIFVFYEQLYKGLTLIVLLFYCKRL